MSKVDKYLYGAGAEDVFEMGTPDVRRLLAAAWHVQLADAAIDEGNVLLAKDHIKSAIAAVKEFNK